MSVHEAESRRYNFVIEGMTCSACAARLERMLSNTDGIVEAAVNLPLERATVDVDAVADLEAVVGVVRRTGFDVGTETRLFTIDGLNDPSGAQQIENALRATPGVVAVDVNLATEQAHVTVVSLAAPDEALVAPVKAVGYDLAAVQGPDAAAEREHRKALQDRRAIIASVALTAPFMLQMLGMMGAGHALGWNLHLHPFIEAALATPLQFLVGARFYRGAFNALRGGGANMDVLVALGTTAAYLYSWYLILMLGAAAQGQLFFEASATDHYACVDRQVHGKPGQAWRSPSHSGNCWPVSPTSPWCGTRTAA